MNTPERVFLQSSKQASKIFMAANLFAKQYGSVHIYIRGSVLDANNVPYHYTEWYTVAVINANLNLIGIGDMGKDEENFHWVRPTEEGEILLTTLQVEAKVQKA